jgi:hypothetical protein
MLVCSEHSKDTVNKKSASSPKSNSPSETPRNGASSNTAKRKRNAIDSSSDEEEGQDKEYENDDDKSYTGEIKDEDLDDALNTSSTEGKSTVEKKQKLDTTNVKGRTSMSSATKSGTPSKTSKDVPRTNLTSGMRKSGGLASKVGTDTPK